MAGRKGFLLFLSILFFVVLFPLGADSTVKIPLDPDSPWPKFRANPMQNGRTTMAALSRGEGPPWEFRTGGGIFSSPVIDGDGNIYIGSADHVFYCLRQDGKLKWSFPTGDIIDSSALLDDRGRVYVGSGDRHVYCLDRTDGRLIWKFTGHSPEEVEELYGIETHNLAWFEGNIAMLPDGRILAPNDNYLVYALDRDTGTPVGVFPGNEMIWSLPAVNPDTGRLFFGTTYTMLKNLYCYDYRTGKRVWTRGSLGSNAASVLLTPGEKGLALVGGFDGFLRAYSQKNGRQVWKFGTRDHIYASPASLSDGTIVQASTDGTVYGLDGEKGKVLWAFDTLEPIRSSPAVDALDRIYFGSGSGHLYCLNPDGSLRWKYSCIHEDRNDLNGSPALGKAGIVIAGENGGIYFVPYDYPLSGDGSTDAGCASGCGEDMPDAGSFLLYTRPFGAPDYTDRIEIPANAPLTFSLLVRDEGDTVLSAMDPKSIQVDYSAPQAAQLETASHGRFLSIIPRETWTGGTFDLTLRGTYRTDRKRIGLFFFGGKKAGQFERTFRVSLTPPEDDFPDFKIPEKPGDESSVLEISRLSVPLPTMLPSYNQIGFDSLRYLAGFVEGTRDKAVLWVIPGKKTALDESSVPDPSLRDLYVLNLEMKDSLVTLSSYEDVILSFFGSWDMPFSLFRLAGEASDLAREGGDDFAFSCVVRGDDIDFYGKFLKITGMSDLKTGLMPLSGGARVSPAGERAIDPALLFDDVSIYPEKNRFRAVLRGSRLRPEDHVAGLLLVDPADGRAVAANYSRETELLMDADGYLSEIRLTVDPDMISGPVRVYLMMDTCPVYRVEISRSEE
ncbi:MAG: PQQ-binding-like beta-propeller repeat protein [Spirochaetales bacterium]|nr:PQQ-binding-like beta-propeller repeat protein [Spirochaetales bacterium]